MPSITEGSDVATAFFSALHLSLVSRRPAWKGKRLLFIDTWKASFAID